jgi:amyloid beta precursor protein binding protein 1
MAGGTGIGRFTIADDAIVEEADLGVNFFLDEQCLGKKRSQCCASLLQELNPDVQGNVSTMSFTYYARLGADL